MKVKYLVFLVLVNDNELYVNYVDLIFINKFFRFDSLMDKKDFGV